MGQNVKLSVGFELSDQMVPLTEQKVFFFYCIDHRVDSNIPQNIQIKEDIFFYCFSPPLTCPFGSSGSSHRTITVFGDIM